MSLFKQQRDTSRLLAGLVYKMLVLDKAVPTGTRFCRRYRITDQREAQRGTYDTIGNGVQTREYSQVFQHTSKVVTMQFGSILGITVPSVAEELIQRELGRVGTSWELTRTIEVLEYGTTHPTLTDRISQKLGSCSRAEKLDSVLTMAELMCGMVNVQPDAFVCVLEKARRALRSDRPEVLVVGDTLFRVISQDSNTGIGTRSKLMPEFSVYTTSNKTSRGEGVYKFTMEQVTRRALGDNDLAFTDESSFRDQAIEMPVNYVYVGGGGSTKIPIVQVDGVQMEHGCGRETSMKVLQHPRVQVGVLHGWLHGPGPEPGLPVQGAFGHGRRRDRIQATGPTLAFGLVPAPVRRRGCRRDAQRTAPSGQPTRVVRQRALRQAAGRPERVHEKRTQRNSRETHGPVGTKQRLVPKDKEPGVSVGV